MTAKKKILIGIVSVFAIVNVLWGLNYLINYRPYMQKITDTGDLGYFEHDGYTFDISSYEYLSFEFNVSISENRYLNQDMKDISDVSADLIVWISPLGKKEYGVSFFYKETSDDGAEQNKGFDIMIDSNGKQLGQLSEQEQKIFDSCAEKIEILLREYNEIWG